MLLSDLVRDSAAVGSPPLCGLEGAPVPDPAVCGVTADSREVRPGWLFAALPGTRADGNRYIPEAIARGAVAVLARPGTRLPETAHQACLITHSEPRWCLARIAARFHRVQPERIACVTGTDGKTSVTEFIRQLWQATGKPAASLGTLGLTTSRGQTGPGLTTPDPVLLHATLRELAEAEIDRVALEASSHGLDQYRLDGVRILAAAFTNLGRDHIDYHGSGEAYRSAKIRLFSELLDPNGHAVLNADDGAVDLFAAACRHRGIPMTLFGRSRDADLVLEVCVPGPGSSSLVLRHQGARHDVVLPLPGVFQAMNVLAALAVTSRIEDIPLAELIPLVETLRGVPGRLEQVGSLHGTAGVYVDFAHTPDALRSVLAALRPHVAGRLICVFGAGGDRDPGKREPMGRAVGEAADLAVVTDDNPRSEDPASIRRAVLAGCSGSREIGDRAEAIAFGIDLLLPDDALVIAGKGHETGQQVGDRLLPFDDRLVARRLLAERGGAVS